MTVHLSTAGAAPPSAAASHPDDFDRRWAAWQARSAARDGVVQRRLALLAPVLVAAAILAVWLLGR